MASSRDREEDVELGEEITARRKTGTALVAVRISADLLKSIQNYAKARELTMSDVLRLGAERLLLENSANSFTMTVNTIGQATLREPTRGGGWAHPPEKTEAARLAVATK